jgi:hypothetical protein
MGYGSQGETEGYFQDNSIHLLHLCSKFCETKCIMIGCKKTENKPKEQKKQGKKNKKKQNKNVS